MKVLLVGLGHWGTNILRILTSNISGVEVKICDPNTQADYKSIDEIREPINACFIVTPANTHYDLAVKSLERGWHTFIEKPMTKSIEEAQDLKWRAYYAKKVLFVDHQYLHHPAIIKIKELIPQLGRLYYIYARRLKLGKLRDDVDTLWNFAPHDISVFNYLTRCQPLDVNCSGWRYQKFQKADMAFMNLRYPNNINCHLQVSWLDYQRVRDMVVCGSNGAIHFDDIKMSIKLVNKEGSQDIDFDKSEPLFHSVRSFINACNMGEDAITNGQNGLEVVKILKAASESMNNNGEPVRVSVAGEVVSEYC